MCSMSPDVVLVRDNWIFPVRTLCAITAIINGRWKHFALCLCSDFFCRCIAEHETECPTCAREHGVIREIRLNNEKLANQHDVFVSDVEDNGFEAVASAFSRGLLNTSS